MNKTQKRIEKLEKEIELQQEQIWGLSQFIKILMMGHKTDRRHKNIFKLMYEEMKNEKK